MNTIISCSTTYVPFLSRELEYIPTSVAQSIVCVDADTHMPVAGVIYDCYNGATIHAHIWVSSERRPSREWYAAIFDYPFNVLRVVKIVGQVNSSNSEARKLDEHFGFVMEAEIKDYYEHGNSLMVYTMTREQCRVLNSQKWGRVVNQISRAA